MELMRHRNLPTLLSLQEDMNGVLQRFLNQPPFAAGTYVPPVNVEETDKEIVVTAEIPGINPKDVTISLDGRELLIKGEKKPLFDKERKANCLLDEIPYGAFTRRITLPVDVLNDKSTADFKLGFLRIALPKADLLKKTQIPIHVARE